MAEWVLHVECFVCTDHDSVWGVQLRKLVNRDAVHSHLILMVLPAKLSSYGFLCPMTRELLHTSC